MFCQSSEPWYLEPKSRSVVCLYLLVVCAMLHVWKILAKMLRIGREITESVARRINIVLFFKIYLLFFQRITYVFHYLFISRWARNRYYRSLLNYICFLNGWKFSIFFDKSFETNARIKQSPQYCYDLHICFQFNIHARFNGVFLNPNLSVVLINFTRNH